MKFDPRLQRQIFSRSFLLQAAWDYRHMQGVGFAFGLLPCLRRLYSSAEERRAAVRRHLEYFNTNPYMAGIALGVAARQESALAEDPCAETAARITRSKGALGAALAAVGDPLFWGSWRPFCVTLAAVVLLLSPARGGGWIVALGVILYNVPVWTWRWRGIRWGFEDGEKVAFRLARMGLQRRLRQIRWGGFAAAAIGAVLLFAAAPPWLESGRWERLGAFAVSLLAKRAGASGPTVYLALLGLGIALALIS